MKKVQHIWLDFSSAQAFQACPRKFKLALVDSLEPTTAGDPSTQAHYRGTLIHQALDAIAKGEDWNKVLDSIPETAAIRQIPEHLSGSLLHIRAIIEAYIEHYQDDAKYWGTCISTEQTFQMPLTSQITWVGTVDKILRAEHGSLAVLDHKTSSSLSRFLAPNIALSDQFTGYIALAQAASYNTSTLIVDGISTALSSLREDRGLFVRYETERTPEQITDFKERMTSLGKTMIKDIELYQENILGQNISLPTPACLAYGSKCQFMDVCSAPKEQGSLILKQTFRLQAEPWKNFKIQWRAE